MTTAAITLERLGRRLQAACQKGENFETEEIADIVGTIRDICHENLQRTALTKLHRFEGIDPSVFSFLDKLTAPGLIQHLQGLDVVEKTNFALAIQRQPLLDLIRVIQTRNSKGIERSLNVLENSPLFTTNARALLAVFAQKQGLSDDLITKIETIFLTSVKAKRGVIQAEGQFTDLTFNLKDIESISAINNPKELNLALERAITEDQALLVLIAMLKGSKPMENIGKLLVRQTNKSSHPQIGTKAYEVELERYPLALAASCNARASFVIMRDWVDDNEPLRGFASAFEYGSSLDTDTGRVVEDWYYKGNTGNQTVAVLWNFARRYF